MCGADLFSLTKRQLEQYCGPVDGRRLDGHITLSRNASGVSFISTAPENYFETLIIFISITRRELLS